MEELYCGTDIGTSSVKTVIFDQDFKPLFQEVNSYELISQEKNRAELDPEEVYRAVLKSLNDCQEKVRNAGKKLKFIAFSSALHSLIAVDDTFTPLTNCITWADTRAMEFHDQLASYYKENDIYNKTGCPPHAIYMPAKILWFKKYARSIYEKTSKFITIKEYIIYKFTGEAVVDYSLASGGGLLNIHQKDWEEGLLNYLEIDRDRLSQLIDGKVILKMNRQTQEDIGADIPLVVGSGDGPLANLGTGSYRENRYVATIGSSGAIRVFAEKPVLDSQTRTWCYMLDEDNYLPGGAINNGGIVLQWLRDNLFNDNSSEENFFNLVNDYLKEVPPGSRGLLFLPFLTGERSPNWNSFARGLIIGLGLSHTRKDITRAAMEGILFRMYSVILALESNIHECREILANGGFTRSESWLQMMADIFGTRVISYKDHEASATGAAFMGAVAFGIYNDYQSIKPYLEIKTIKVPDLERNKIYKHLYFLHEKVYNKNKDLFKELL